MKLIPALIFYGSFVVILLTTIYIYLVFYNKRAKKLINQFLLQASNLQHETFENIHLRYWTTNGMRTLLSPNNTCDLLLFDNCLAIIRRQNFVFKVWFPPILITAETESARGIFNYLESFKPKRIHFNGLKKGEVAINITDPIKSSLRIDITLKALTQVQVERLNKIESWS